MFYSNATRRTLMMAMMLAMMMMMAMMVIMVNHCETDTADNNNYDRIPHNYEPALIHAIEMS